MPSPLSSASLRIGFILARRFTLCAFANFVDVLRLAADEGDRSGDAAARDAELDRLRDMAAFAHELGLEVHAGHGLTYDTVKPVAAIPQVMELNIGHFLIGEAIHVGLEAAIRRMRVLMDEARAVAAA